MLQSHENVKRYEMEGDPYNVSVCNNNLAPTANVSVCNEKSQKRKKSLATKSEYLQTSDSGRSSEL